MQRSVFSSLDLLSLPASSARSAAHRPASSFSVILIAVLPVVISLCSSLYLGEYIYF